MKTKVKILDKLPEVTDAEIEGLMNFEDLYQDYQIMKLAGGSMPLFEKVKNNDKYWKWTLVLLGIGLISLLSYRLILEESTSVTQSPLVLGEMTVEKPEKVKPLTMPIVEDIQKQNQPEKTESVKKETKKAPVLEKKEEQVASKGFKPAEPLAGYQQLYEFFAREVQYKGEMLSDSVAINITVEFSITSDGQVVKVKVQNPNNEVMDAEAIRLVRNMPDWKPATMNGKPVESRLNIPLSFGITNETIEK
tara:strand:+ start:231 stop:977 length:747 start_codon:yes stop_codon:yes gene_type:complete